jgi:hypothetical protein
MIKQTNKQKPWSGDGREVSTYQSHTTFPSAAAAEETSQMWGTSLALEREAHLQGAAKMQQADKEQEIT